jgi:hypothetical protein
MSSQPSFYYSVNEYSEPELKSELDLNLNVLTTQSVFNSFDNNLFNIDLDLDLDSDDYKIDNSSLSELFNNNNNNIFNKSFTVRSNLILFFSEAIYFSKQEQIDSI